MLRWSVTMTLPPPCFTVSWTGAFGFHVNVFFFWSLLGLHDVLCSGMFSHKLWVLPGSGLFISKPHDTFISFRLMLPPLPVTGKSKVFIDMSYVLMLRPVLSHVHQVFCFLISLGYETCKLSLYLAKHTYTPTHTQLHGRCYDYLLFFLCECIKGALGKICQNVSRLSRWCWIKFEWFICTPWTRPTSTPPLPTVYTKLRPPGNIPYGGSTRFRAVTTSV